MQQTALSTQSILDGGRLHEIRTELLAEFTEPFRAALERLLGKQSVWLE
jgi:hypothetical protein